MATNNQLKAYVRFDGTGRVIPGSLILQRSKPKVGNWTEIDANECCNYVPTTTTTTTVPVTTTTTTTVPVTTTTTTVAPTTTTTTTTAAVLSFVGRGGSTSGEACAGTNETFYTTGPFQAEIYPQTGNVIYFDQAMTQLVTYAYVSSPGMGAVFQCTNGALSNMSPC
jgi:hypothetical protein